MATKLPGPIDLHSHTTFSDGILSTQELVAEAQRRGLSALAITDHDGLQAVPIAQKLTQGTDLEIISGVEVSASLEENTLHILGLFVDHQHPGLRQYLSELVEGRQVRAQKILKQLASVNVNLDFDAVLQRAKGAAVGRNHIAMALVEKGLVQSRQEAFDRYLGRGRPGFATYERAHPKDAIHWIKKAGGLSFLAHPGLIRQQYFVSQMIDLGISGLEVVHPEHESSTTKRYGKLCDGLRILKSGGSDYHGPNMGRKGDLGEMRVPHEFLSAMKAALGLSPSSAQEKK